MLSFTRELMSEISTMPRALWVLTGGQFINRFGSFVFPFLSLYLVEQNLTLGKVAWVIGAMSVGGIFAPFAGGYLADAMGRRNTIVLSLVGSAVTVLGIYFASSFIGLVAISFLHGFLTYMFGPAANALMSDVVPAEKRVLAFAIFRLALNAGFAAGPAVAGFLFTRSPMLIFVGDAVTTLVFAGLALALLPHGLRTVKGRVSSPRVAWLSWKEAAQDGWRNGPFLQLLIAKLFMAVAFVQVFNILALDTKARGLTTVEYGLVMGFNGFIIMVVELPLAQWIKRFPAKPVSALGFGIIGLGCGSFAFANELWEFFVAMGLFTLGEMIALPVSAAYGAQVAPEKYRGRYFGFFSVMWGFSAVVGSAGIRIYESIGSNWWLLTGACGVLAAAILIPVFRDTRPAIFTEKSSDSMGAAES
ncbi:MAG: MFS transporter [Opitutaceae bacterium]|nr:MFS transporter [Opitutaceae bacterium]